MIIHIHLMHYCISIMIDIQTVIQALLLSAFFLSVMTVVRFLYFNYEYNYQVDEFVRFRKSIKKNELPPIIKNGINVENTFNKRLDQVNTTFDESRKIE